MALSLNLLDDSGVSAEVEEGLVGGDDSMESEVVEVLEASEEVTEAEELLEEAEEAQDNLESFREILRADIEAGERLSPSAARHLIAHANTVFGRVGVEVQRVNTESFSSPSDSADALMQLNMEADGLWGKIIDFVMGLVNRVRKAMKTLWVKISDSAPAIAKRAKALAERANKTKGTLDSRDFEFGSAKSIHSEGKVVRTKVIEGIGKLDDLTNKVLVRGKDNWKSRYSELETLVSGMPDNLKKETFIASTKKLSDSIEGLSKTYGLTDLTDKTAYGFDANDQVKSSGEMLGGRIFYVSYGKENANTEAVGDWQRYLESNSISAATPEVQQVTDDLNRVSSFREGSAIKTALEVDATQTVETLSTSEVVKICNSIEDIANRISKYRRAFDERDGAKTKVVNKLKDAQKKLAKMKDDEISSNHRRLAERLLRSAASLGRDEMASHVSKHAIVVSKALLGYCEKSLAQYK